MKRFDDDIRVYGFVVGGEYDHKGNYYYAEITPSGSHWLLPSVRRWWYEVHSVQKKPEKIGKGLSIRTATHAYCKSGSGGSYTLRGCTRKALSALQDISLNQDVIYD